jgi:hypothetical protein
MPPEVALWAINALLVIVAAMHAHADKVREKLMDKMEDRLREVEHKVWRAEPEDRRAN